ncbi:MAG: folate-binding protein [bacterium]|nr:folate-binding protein [bacterium]MDI1337268.1 folate-binding protein [Lacunisphaera sp.]
MRIHLYRPAALLNVTGDDAGTFLQGQFTNDLRQDTGAAVYGLWLTQKGKVLADSCVLKLAENKFQVVSLNSPVTVIQPRLEGYIVADDVTLTDQTSQAHGLAVAGLRSGEMLQKVLGGTPGPGRFIKSGDRLAFAGHRLRGENYELIGPESIITDTRRKLIALGGREADSGEMEFARIMDAMPSIPQDLGPADLPNEGGLEDAAISFTKGCYLGQEVMARLKTLGQIRRRLQVVQGAGAPPPLAPLYQGEKKVGQIRSVATRGNEFVALAMLSLVNLDPAAGLSLAPDAAATVKLISRG